MPTEPVRWGVIGAARIALDKVIPSMQDGELSRVVAIASRSGDRARAAAESLGIDRAYDSYEALIDDPEVEAIYNPLPNHLHVPWSIRAAQAGKHVLCEKPISLSAREAVELRDAARQAGVLIGEAFMVRAHPQWIETKRLIDGGRIGALQLVHGHFSYPRREATDVRSRVGSEGGRTSKRGASTRAPFWKAKKMGCVNTHPIKPSEELPLLCGLLLCALGSFLRHLLLLRS